MDFAAQLDSDGYAVVESVLGDDAVAQLIQQVEQFPETGPRGGRRNLLAVSEMRRFAESPLLMLFVHAILGENAFPVRGILFDKQPGANWKVPWHQDLTIAVKQRLDAPGYGPWSVKEGIVHVQPPTDVWRTC